MSILEMSRSFDTSIHKNRENSATLLEKMNKDK